MDFKGKKACLLGFGVENQALLPYLVNRGADITTCDKNSELPQNISGAHYQVGKDYLNDLAKFDILFRSPSISYFNPEIQKARGAGVEITSSTKLFFQICPAKIIGVTGTKGKGTTASLIYEILKNSGRTVHLVGNIGNPAMSVLENIKAGDWVVYEVSSFQLEDLNMSPHIAVVLNITSDHLDRHSSVSEYVAAKKNILSHQTKNDFAVINADNPSSPDFAKETKAEVYFVSAGNSIERGAVVREDSVFLKTPLETEICDSENIKLKGFFNLQNVASASVASFLAGAEIEVIIQTVKNFKGLPHRLEFVDEVDGIKFYDDSIATAPEATIAAISSFAEPITLILGGSSKRADYSKLLEEIAKSSVKRVILIGEEGGKLHPFFKKSNIESVLVKSPVTMEAIVDQAISLSVPGSVVLFSPAAASFDMFKDAYDRGEQFKKAIGKLVKSF